jgi:hypothetical protein
MSISTFATPNFSSPWHAVRHLWRWLSHRIRRLNTPPVFPARCKWCFVSFKISSLVAFHFILSVSMWCYYTGRHFLYFCRLPSYLLTFHLIFYCQAHLESVVIYTSILFFYENCSSQWCIDFKSLCCRLLAWHFKLAHTNWSWRAAPKPTHPHINSHKHTQLDVVKTDDTVNSFPSVTRFSVK